MNRNVKKIIACTLAVGTVVAAAPAATYNPLIAKAYANDAHEVNSIDLKDKDGNSLKLYKDVAYTNIIDKDFQEGNTYYTTTTSASVRFASVGGPDDDNVRIFRGDNTDSNDDYEIGHSISLTDSTTVLRIRVYKHHYDDDKHRGSSYYDEYKIYVKYTGDSKDLDDDKNHHHDDDDNDDEYLDSLDLYDKNGHEIKLYEDSAYDDRLDNDDLDDDNEGDTYYAKTSSDKVRIETSGPDDDYVRVFNSTKDSAKGKETGEDISVSGDETLTVRIYSDEPDDDIRYEDDEDVVGEYKIKLKYTGTNDSTETNTGSSTTGNTPVSNVKPNQWVQVNGNWQYNDTLGNPLKNQWHYDGYYCKWYYLDYNGIMSKNCWVLTGGKWYYVGYNGAMLTNSWVLTGGKWYYVGSDGAMATNTYVSGYKIGWDGAWIQ